MSEGQASVVGNEMHLMGSFFMDFFKNEDSENTGTLKKCFLTNTESYFWKLGEKTWLIIPCRGVALVSREKRLASAKVPRQRYWTGKGPRG